MRVGWKHTFILKYNLTTCFYPLFASVVVSLWARQHSAPHTTLPYHSWKKLLYNTWDCCSCLKQQGEIDTSLSRYWCVPNTEWRTASTENPLHTEEYRVLRDRQTIVVGILCGIPIQSRNSATLLDRTIGTLQLANQDWLDEGRRNKQENRTPVGFLVRSTYTAALSLRLPLLLLTLVSLPAVWKCQEFHTDTRHWIETGVHVLVRTSTPVHVLLVSGKNHFFNSPTISFGPHFLMTFLLWMVLKGFVASFPAYPRMIFLPPWKTWHEVWTRNQTTHTPGTWRRPGKKSKGTKREAKPKQPTHTTEVFYHWLTGWSPKNLVTS